MKLIQIHTSNNLCGDLKDSILSNGNVIPLLCRTNENLLFSEIDSKIKHEFLYYVKISVYVEHTMHTWLGEATKIGNSKNLIDKYNNTPLISAMKGVINHQKTKLKIFIENSQFYKKNEVYHEITSSDITEEDALIIMEHRFSGQKYSL